MIMLLNVLLTFFFWFSLLSVIKIIKLKLVFKLIFLSLGFIIYIFLYYKLFSGVFNLYNYLIICFTFLYIFIYK